MHQSLSRLACEQPCCSCQPRPRQQLRAAVLPAQQRALRGELAATHAASFVGSQAASGGPGLTETVWAITLGAAALWLGKQLYEQARPQTQLCPQQLGPAGRASGGMLPPACSMPTGSCFWVRQHRVHARVPDCTPTYVLPPQESSLVSQPALLQRESEPEGPPCPTCGGSGKVDCICQRWSDGDFGCSTCGGSGKATCSNCGGGGTAQPQVQRIYVRAKCAPFLSGSCSCCTCIAGSATIVCLVPADMQQRNRVNTVTSDCLLLTAAACATAHKLMAGC